jgi:hypothetical protein
MRRNINNSLDVIQSQLGEAGLHVKKIVMTLVAKLESLEATVERVTEAVEDAQMCAVQFRLAEEAQPSPAWQTEIDKLKSAICSPALIAQDRLSHPSTFPFRVDQFRVTETCGGNSWRCLLSYDSRRTFRILSGQNTSLVVRARQIGDQLTCGPSSTDMKSNFRITFVRQVDWRTDQASFVEIRETTTNGCFDVHGGIPKAQSGTAIVLFRTNQSMAQQWRIEAAAVPGGFVQIVPVSRPEWCVTRMLSPSLLVISVNRKHDPDPLSLWKIAWND